MATIINNWDEEDIREVLYRRPSRMLDAYHDSVFSADDTGRRFSERFRDGAKRLVDKVKSNAAYRRTLSSFRKLRNFGTDNDVKYLHDVGEMQHASPRMQNIILAEPLIREPWLQGKLAGYEEGFSKNSVNRKANRSTNNIWRDINSSVVHSEGEDAVSHTFAFQPDEERMTLHERSVARQTQVRAVELMWERMDDMTSTYNARL